MLDVVGPHYHPLAAGADDAVEGLGVLGVEPPGRPAAEATPATRAAGEIDLVLIPVFVAQDAAAEWDLDEAVTFAQRGGLP